MFANLDLAEGVFDAVMQVILCTVCSLVNYGFVIAYTTEQIINQRKKLTFIGPYMMLTAREKTRRNQQP